MLRQSLCLFILLFGSLTAFGCSTKKVASAPVNGNKSQFVSNCTMNYTHDYHNVVRSTAMNKTLVFSESPMCPPLSRLELEHSDREFAINIGTATKPHLKSTGIFMNQIMKPSTSSQLTGTILFKRLATDKSPSARTSTTTQVTPAVPPSSVTSPALTHPVPAATVETIEETDSDNVSADTQGINNAPVTDSALVATPSTTLPLATSQGTGNKPASMNARGSMQLTAASPHDSTTSQGKGKAWDASNNPLEYPCMSPIIFSIKSAVVDKSARESILSCIASLKSCKHIRTTGYTSDTGSDKYNNKLALERATAVSNILAEQGIKTDEVIGEGKCCYVSNEQNKNRRVEIKCTY